MPAIQQRGYLMAVGKITFTNGSAAVNGTDTTFKTDLAIVDYILIEVGETFYFPSIQSNTALTLTGKYDGPTSEELAHTVIPQGHIHKSPWGWSLNLPTLYVLRIWIKITGIRFSALRKK